MKLRSHYVLRLRSKLLPPHNTKKMLILCYHTDDEQLIKIANRYWSIDESGKYLERSTSFFIQTGATHAAQQTKILAQIATAFVANSRCKTCNRPQQIKSRSSSIRASERDCDECITTTLENERKILAEKSATSAQKLSEALQRVSERNHDKRASFQLLNDDQAILILALNRTLGDQLFDEGFGFLQKHCVNLAPSNWENYVTRLYKEGLLIINPQRSGSNAFFLKDEKLWHRSDQVIYEIVPDATIASGQDVINILRARPFNQGEVIKTLWIEYATNDCMAYLYTFSGEHGLSIEEDEDNEIENILRAALSVDSVANLWSAIWKIVKDAAALSTQKYYNSRKAAATLPGKLKRYLEMVRKGERSLGKWDRPKNQVAGSLGEVFYEIWGIDENTPGTWLEDVFPKPNNDIEADELSLNRQVVTQMLRQTVEQDLAPEMLLTFASEISEGKSLMEALKTAYSVVSPCQLYQKRR